jgi:hypothetical protein
MKFAVLAALVATAEAGRRPRGLEEDLTEDVRVHYPAETVKGFMGMMQEIEKLGQEGEENLHKKWPTMERDMRNMGKWAAERYGQDAMTFAHSSSVRAAEGHKKAMAKTSKELHVVM